MKADLGFEQYIRVRIYDDLEHKLPKDCVISMDTTNPIVLHVHIRSSNDFRYTFSFDPREFESHSQENFDNLIIARKNMVALEMRESAKELVSIAKILEN
jgi:hypothetical protein